MPETEVRWRYAPNPDKYRRLLNLLFREPVETVPPLDMERGRIA